MTATAPPPGTDPLVTGFTITVPSNWVELDLHPATLRSGINRLVRERLREVPELAAHRDSVAKAIRSVAREASESGAVYCGLLVDAADGAVMTASVTVTIRQVPQLDDDPDVLRSLLDTRSGGSSGDTWRRVETVTVPQAGPVVRLTGREDVTMPEGSGWVRCVLMQTVFPLPGGSVVAMVSCATPVLVAEEAFLQLFGAITDTFRFTRV